MRNWGRLSSALPLAALLLLAAVLSAANPTTKIKVVVKTLAGRPVDRAEVILRWKASPKHPRNALGSKQFESRTSQEGEASFPGVPQGNIQIQVHAKGFQTFGQIFDIDDDEKTIEVKLNPPQQQYSSH